jgi:thiol-disulfide isomerase/thioredoxin
MNMNRNHLTLLIILSLLITRPLWSQGGHPEPQTLTPGSQAPDFSLRGVDGRTYTLSSFKKAKVLVIVFSCNHCPTAQAYEDRIIAIANDYRPKGAEIVMISPNAVDALNYSELGYSDLGDSYEEMKMRATDKSFPFPYLYDGEDQKTALAFGPVATPHCFVLDNDRIIRYAGRIDGSEKPGTGRGEDLRNAVDAVLSGQPVTTPVTKVFGCSVKWAWKNEYTKKLYKEWAELPVTLDEIDADGVRELIRNNTGKVRLINIWASWCGPCIAEMPDLVIIDRMYRGRPFELVTVSADKMSRKVEALRILKENQASNRNYIFSKDDVYELIEAVDPEWQGALPYTMLIEPGGKILYRKQDTIDPLQMKKLIVGSQYLGRYY